MQRSTILASLLLATALAAQPAGFRIETVATGINLGCAMAFAPDGRLFVTERVTGNIRVIENGQLRATPWATITRTGTSGSEQGLLGIAVDPSFLTNRYVYVMYTRTTTTTHNVIARLTEVGGVGTNLTVIGPQVTSVSIHNGGPLAFGHDGKLYHCNGDAGTGSNAQSLASLNGKILRMNRDGSVPTDNPFVTGAQPLVWSYGHRNQFGLCIHPVTGLPYTTENGQNTRDEVNRIVRGGNYGWPQYEGTEPTPDPSTVDPLRVFAPTPDPTGCCFYTGAHYPATYLHGWFMCKFSFGQLALLTLDAAGTTVLSDTTFHTYTGGLIFAVNDGPDGNLWTLHVAGTTRGGDTVNRFVYNATPLPALNACATSNRSVDGSVTLGFMAGNGDACVPWIGATRYAAPIVTPFGDLWVPFDLVLPAVTVTADSRAYLGLTVPNDPALVNVAVHFQGASANPNAIKTTNPVSFTLRGG
jgi:glucose/arabinose dehydrogenase